MVFDSESQPSFGRKPCSLLSPYLPSITYVQKLILASSEWNLGTLRVLGLACGNWKLSI